MAHVSTPLTWSLDSTAGTTISVFKDVMRAATSDNVQPLALMTCEKFGATLAMCPETNKKMEDLIIKVSGPKHVRFMKAQIGYSANDSATQLSRSLAGIQFLGLAAALTSSTEIFRGANALSVMLMDSASDKTLLPTVRQLKDLLGVMEHRLIRSGFADIWVGYQILLSSSLSASSDRDLLKQPDRLAPFEYIPDNYGFCKLVEAFRQLNRLGDATTITVRTTSCAPWVMAFTRWCLGLPPSIYLPSGKALLAQPASRIALFTANSANDSTFEITVHRSVDSPAELLRLQGPIQRTMGMVTVECLGQKLCHEMGGRGSMTYKAICEVLPYALKQSCELLQILDSGDRASAKEQFAKFRAKDQFAKHRAQPFPEDCAISSVLTRVLNSEYQQYLQRLDDGQLIPDLPLVRQCMQNLATSCRCNDCQSIRDYGASERKKDEFLFSIADHVAIILLISLFESSESLLVSRDRHWLSYSGKAFRVAIHRIIKSGEPAACTASQILDWARALVQHKGVPDDLRCVVSCCKGQAVYPRVFETREICQPGYLVLYWAPGLLYFDGEVYDMVIDQYYSGVSKVVLNEEMIIKLGRTRPVTEPLNLFPNRRIEWKVLRHDGYLAIYLDCEKYVGSPSCILLNLADALVVLCPHDRASPLHEPDSCSRYINPFPVSEYNSSIEDRTRQINVIAVDGSTDLRMFALSDPNGNLFVVIRNNACLQCCLDLCREAGYKNLIC